jgi:hypothetical protein
LFEILLLAPNFGDFDCIVPLYLAIVCLASELPAIDASKGFTGSGLPLQIWARFMRYAKKYRPDLLTGNFEMPPSVREISIDPNAGCISQTGIKEYYLSDRLPPVCY